MAEIKWGFLYPFEPFPRGRPCDLPRWWGSCQSPGPAWGRVAGRASCRETPWVSLGRASWPRKVEDTGGHTAPPPRPRAATPGSCSAARSSGARPGPCSVDIISILRRYGRYCRYSPSLSGYPPRAPWGQTRPGGGVPAVWARGGGEGSHGAGDQRNLQHGGLHLL